jgi:hypothetical protein
MLVGVLEIHAFFLEFLKNKMGKKQCPLGFSVVNFLKKLVAV